MFYTTPFEMKDLVMNNSPVFSLADDHANSRAGARAAIFRSPMAPTSVSFFAANFTTCENRLGVNHV
jgi:hypothetical protein